MTVFLYIFLNQLFSSHYIQLYITQVVQNVVKTNQK